MEDHGSSVAKADSGDAKSSGERSVDLFGAPLELRRATCFGEGLDALARQRGAWPATAVAYSVEVINERTAVLIKGGIPTGTTRQGFPAFAKRGQEYVAVISLPEYRATFAKAGERS